MRPVAANEAGPVGDDRGLPAEESGGITLRRLLTAAEVAGLLRVPRSTIYKLAPERRIPYLKVGRRILFDPHALGEWIESASLPVRK